MQNLTETYRSYSDDEIARLHGELDSLTEEARYALLAEIGRRGLKEQEIAKIQDEEARHAAEYDQEHRQETKDKLVIGAMTIFGGAIGGTVARTILGRRKRATQGTSESETSSKA